LRDGESSFQGRHQEEKRVIRVEKLVDLMWAAQQQMNREKKGGRGEERIEKKKGVRCGTVKSESWRGSRWKGPRMSPRVSLKS